MVYLILKKKNTEQLTFRNCLLKLIRKNRHNIIQQQNPWNEKQKPSPGHGLGQCKNLNNILNV
jgi:hypothetical protein